MQFLSCKPCFFKIADTMEPETLVQCPYDKNHHIRPSRLPYHLVKCRENNPQIAKMLATCPYNARHRVPKQELKLHISTCADRSDPELFEEISIKPKEEVSDPPSFWKSPPCEENWDADEEPVSPFILGVSGNSFLMKQRAEQSFKSSDLGSSNTPIGQVPTFNSWKQGEMFQRAAFSKQVLKEEPLGKSLQYATSTCTLVDKLRLRVPGTAHKLAESTGHWKDEAAAPPFFLFKTVGDDKEDSKSSQTLTAPISNPWRKDVWSSGASGHSTLSSENVTDHCNQKGHFQGSQTSAASDPRYSAWKRGTM
ncbi:uncharacterized protein LOC115466794 isoform X2 [Microcaecilia unicolor]|uniref:Uncharacterized protein LOC115466794 isoform X2 n=1 Tax=Microcaecilia unicolor TaxID=1415580 RepID=A0A6P7XU36_9AMPH|nr:uncharacterized protein LOC115466794 isoform X2 [Microcaecilia unicolor]